MDTDPAIDALLSLLADEDPGTCGPILVRLEHDTDLFDRAWRIAVDSPHGTPPLLVQACLRQDGEALIDAYADCDDLEAGCALLARLDQPRRDHRPAIATALDALATAVQGRLQPPAIDGRTVARCLAQDFGFAGNEDRYDDPANSYLTTVLERRCGLPIALTAVWMLVCRRLHVPAVALALPGHVVGRWTGISGEQGYLDLFANAADLTRHDLDLRVRLAGEDSATPYLAAASDKALLRRMARNLAVSHLRRGDSLRATIAHALSG